MREKLENPRNVSVELVVLAVLVCGGGMGSVGLKRRRDVGVDPERPERVVEVEDDEFGEWEAWVE